MVRAAVSEEHNPPEICRETSASRQKLICSKAPQTALPVAQFKAQKLIYGHPTEA
jgi:hypothetical protein